MSVLTCLPRCCANPHPYTYVQVQYVLSDKTGTLTQNVMGFVWASVGGRLYGRAPTADKAPPGVPSRTPHTIALDSELRRALRGARSVPSPGVMAGSEGEAGPLHDFLLNLAVCNTVVPERLHDGTLVYQASSPDEEALVQGAAYLGYVLKSRTTDTVSVEVRGALMTFDIIAVLEFSSDRKRMSIIVRSPDGRLLLMTKGADSIVLARIAAGEPGVDVVQDHLVRMWQCSVGLS